MASESMVIASIAPWFTPTILFVVSNLIIATLFLASKSNTKTATKEHEHHYDHDQDQDQDQDQGYSFTRNIPRVSSLLERVKSVQLSSYIPIIESRSEYLSIPKIAKYTSLSRLAQSIFSSCSYDTQPDSERYPSNKPKPNPSPTLLGRLKSIDFSSIYDDGNTMRDTDSELVTNSPSRLIRMPSFFDRVKSVKIKKVELKKTRSTDVRIVSDDEEDVDLRRPQTARARQNADDDAKADNFISKFRDQLKLQRLESLNRYNDMLKSPN